MTREAYLRELEGLLRALHVEDVEDVIAEYDEHFARKIADGYTEEEIAARLGPPEEIAQQFSAAADKQPGSRAPKALRVVGLAFAAMVAVPFLVAMFVSPVAAGAFSAACIACGVSLLARPLLPESGTFLIPYMPYIGGAALGVSMLALGALAACLAFYTHALAAQTCRAYVRWNRNALSGGKHPPAAKHPLLKDKSRRRLRGTAVISLMILAVSFTAGYLILAAHAGSLGFWHVWHWFE